MARFQNDPFPGTDYTQYQSWPKVVLPNGQVMYEVPGNSGYVFDPVASNASGRKVFRANPKGAISEQQEAEAQQKKLQDQQAFNLSPAGQLIPVAAGTAGLIAASQFGGGSAAASPLAALGANAALQGGVTAPLAGAAASGAVGGAVPLASLAAPTGLSGAIVPIAGETAAAPGLLSGIAPMAGSAGGLAGLGAIAAGTYLGGKAGYDMLKGEKPGLPGRIILGMATGGLSEVGNKLLNRETTRDVAKKHTKDLLNASDDVNYQNYVTGMREQYNSAPPDPSKPFAGKYSNFEEYKKAGLEAADLEGVYGNLKTYGAEWTNMTPEQRRAVTQANIDSGLYNSKKGEVEITDSAKAIENKNNILKGFAVGAKTAAIPAANVQAAAQAAQPAIPRPTFTKTAALPTFVKG